MVVAILLALVLCRPVARRMGIGRGLAAWLIVSFGVVLAATLTPSREAFLYGATGASSCDLSRIRPASWQEYLALGNATFNLLLFMPLGAGLALLPRRRERAVLLLIAILLPFIVETLQLVLPPLGRACQAGDVVDNLLGLLLGFAAGSVIGWLIAEA